MGLNKPITVGGGLTAAEVQSIIDAQTTAIAGKVDAQTNTLITDIPSSISGGASISDINAALDEKLPQYAGGTNIKSKSYGTFSTSSAGATITSKKITLPYTINPDNTIILLDGCVDNYFGCKLDSVVEDGFTVTFMSGDNKYSYQVVEFN